MNPHLAELLLGVGSIILIAALVILFVKLADKADNDLLNKQREDKMVEIRYGCGDCAGLKISLEDSVQQVAIGKGICCMYGKFVHRDVINGWTPTVTGPCPEYKGRIK